MAVTRNELKTLTKTSTRARRTDSDFNAAGKRILPFARLGASIAALDSGNGPKVLESDEYDTALAHHALSSSGRF